MTMMNAASARAEPSASQCASAKEHFARLHDWHIATEDELVYPAAAQRLDAVARIAMGQEMARGRGVR